MSRRNDLDREQLRRYGLYRLSLDRRNRDRPVSERLTREQIRQKARDAVKMGSIGPTGARLSEWQEDSGPQKNR